MELPSNEVRRGLVAGYAAVVESLGLQVGARPLLLPNGEFFPDVFNADEPSVQRLVDRLLEHAGLSDMAVVARFWGATDPSCGAGACGSCGPSQPEPEAVERLLDGGEFWQINVLPREVSAPIALTSALCRAIALSVLHEADSPPGGVPVDLAVDLTAVELGYGVLLLEGSHIYRKSCAGPSIARSTALGPSELGLVLALSTRVHGQAPHKVKKYLSATQQAAWAEATAWADSNLPLAAILRADPQAISRGAFQLNEASSWLARWFSRKVQRAPRVGAAVTIEELEAALLADNPNRAPRQPRDAKFEEIRRLVDEALSE
jgi:hypothetical protein